MVSLQTVLKQINVAIAVEFQSGRCRIAALEQFVFRVSALDDVTGSFLGAPDQYPLGVPTRTMIKLLHSRYLARKVLDLLGVNNLWSIDHAGVVGFLHLCQLLVFDLLGESSHLGALMHLGNSFPLV